MAHAATHDIRQQLRGIAECPICLNTFEDPRTLPCQHTFCSLCISRFASNEQPGDRMKCPSCRDEFTIPSNGVDGLRKNFLIEQLKSVAELQPTSKYCEACSKVGSATGKVAVGYCTDCRQRFCQSCIDSHRQITATSSHSLREIDNGEARPETSTEMATAAVMNCERHPGKPLEIYCLDCKEVTCSSCFFALHNKESHNCCDVNSVAEKFIGHMTSDAAELGQAVERFRVLMAKLAEGKAEIIARRGVIEEEVNRLAEQLKQKIDEDRQMLLVELSSNVSNRLKQIEMIVEGIELHISSMESLIRRTEELKRKGTVVEIAQQHAVLHNTTGELARRDFNDALDELGTVDVSFVVTSLQSNQSLLGRITTKRLSGYDIEVVKSTAPTWVCAVPAGDSVVGLTSLDDRLFVLRDPSQNRLEVYDTETFALQRTLHINALSNRTWRCGLASCTTNLCLYVSDYDENTVHVVDVASDSGDSGGSSWLVGDGPTGLSTNSARNVLVTCCNANKIQEYTTHGILVREVCLHHEEVAEPVHAIQLNNGLYVVSHWEPEQGISVVDNGGRVVVTYRNKRRPIRLFSLFSSQPAVLLNRPGHLAVSESGAVYSAETDTINNRILVFDPSLGSTVDLVSSIHLNGPWSLCLDGFRDKLYVGECGGGRILLLHNLSKCLL